MSRLAAIFLSLVVSVLGGASVVAQEFSGLARVEAGVSRVTDTRGGIRIDIGLSQGVPYRVYTLPDPDRLVMDFREVDWTGLDPAVFDQAQGGIRGSVWRLAARVVADGDRLGHANACEPCRPAHGRRNRCRATFSHIEKRHAGGF